MENLNHIIISDNNINITVFNDDDKLMHFDSLETGYMSDAEGEYYAYTAGSVYLNPDNDSVIRCQNRLYPLSYLGEKYKNVHITYVPARELDYYNFDLHNTGSSSTQTRCNLIEKRILIKTNKNSHESDHNQIKCCLSGRRSAIVFDEFDRAIRLKGCGNLFLGFNLENVDDLGKNHLEVRGAQFKNTCLRELFFTNYVMDNCEKYGLIYGNIPVGFYLYKNVFNGLVNEAELCDKYCGIYLTGGDKRLGSNFFNGLNYILSALFENDEYLTEFFNTFNPQADFNKIKDYLPMKNFSIANDGTFVIEFNKNILDNPLISNNKSQYEQIFFDYCSYLSLFTPEKEITKRLIDSEKKCLEAFIKNTLHQKENHINGVNNIKTQVILQNILEKVFPLCEKNNLNLFSSIITLLSKISYEVGFIKKFFEEIDLNWGTFDYHCNAHLDNFVLLKENSKKLFLAPLDFDLAFTRDQFVDLNYKNAKGIENNLNFDDLLEREKNNLIIQLIGFNMIPNIEVRVLEFIQNSNQSKENLLALMKENIVECFTKGYLKENITKDFESFYELGCELVKLVLALETLTRKN